MNSYAAVIHARQQRAHCILVIFSITHIDSAESMITNERAKREIEMDSARVCRCKRRSVYHSGDDIGR